MMEKQMDVFFDWRWWLIKKYDTLWDKASVDITKEFDSKPIYNKKYLETKVKSHGDEVTDFYNKKLQISLDCGLKKDGSYYPQVFLKE